MPDQLLTRPATLADLPALTALQRADDVHWFGAPEHDEAEVREQLELVPDLATQSRLLHDGDTMVGAAWWWGHETQLLAAAGPQRPVVLELLLDAAIDAGVRDASALAQDAELLAALEQRGWVHRRSAFDLLRPSTDDWELAEPVWPAGVTCTPAHADEGATLHTVIYDDAAWDEIEGHERRPFEQWQAIFVNGPLDSPRHLVIRRDGRPVGVAMSRMFSDGTGWIGQLAVARSERGHGLGRALLLAALRGLREDGAAQLGLAVQAANSRALGLYESVGLRVEREFRSYEPQT